MSREEGFSQRLGMDEAWWLERGSWSAAQVLAPCQSVAQEFSQTSDMQSLVYDALISSAAFPDEWEKLVFVYQLKGYRWTLLESIAGHIYWDASELLSKRLETFAMGHMYEDCGGVYGYQLYENGSVVENYYAGNTGEFEDAVFTNENRRQKIADGWIISDDGLMQFRSERVNRPCVESKSVSVNRTARELGLYIPCDVWEVDSRTGEVKLNELWSEADFQDAKVLLAEV